MWTELAGLDPTPGEFRKLQDLATDAGRRGAAGTPEAVHVEGGKVTTRVKLDRQAVALLILEWTAK